MTRITLTRLSKTMKAFSIDKVLKCEQTGLQSRIGELRFAIENGNKSEDNDGERAVGTSSWRTPMYFIHTQSGSVPHITREVLHMIYPTSSLHKTCESNDASSIPPVQISIDFTFKFVESLGKFDKGIGKFVGLPEVPTFLSIHDPVFPLRPGHNDKFGVSMWSRHGRTTLTPQAYVDALKVYKTSFSQVLSDYDVNPNVSGMKRLEKSTSRAKEYTSKLLKDLSNEKDRCKTGVFISIEAAWFQMNENIARKTVANLLESRQEIEGVVLSGLIDRFVKSKVEANRFAKEKPTDFVKKHGEIERLEVCEELDLQLVSKIIDVLPPSLPKYVPGPLTLVQMVNLISRGVDLFDTSAASRMADNAEVFILDGIEDILPKLTKSVESLNTVMMESLPVRSGDESSSSAQSEQSSGQLPIISLEDKRYFEDFGPISKTCSCYTCRKHTRSYVHHLFATDELLGPVLIQIHNLTAFDRFFKIIRGIIDDSESPEELQQKLNLVKDVLNFKSSKTHDDGKVVTGASGVV